MPNIFKINIAKPLSKRHERADIEYFRNFYTNFCAKSDCKITI